MINLVDIFLTHLMLSVNILAIISQYLDCFDDIINIIKNK